VELAAKLEEIAGLKKMQSLRAIVATMSALNSEEDTSSVSNAS
jgi:hypothetical protein